MEYDGQNPKYNGREHGEGKQRPNGFLHFAVFLCTDLLGQKNLTAGTEARADKGQKLHESAACGNR